MNSNVEMIQVTSSNIESIGYDEQNQIAYVRFLNGSEYMYKDVPQSEFDGLLNAPSIGIYFNKNYRDVYPYEKLQ